MSCVAALAGQARVLCIDCSTRCMWDVQPAPASVTSLKVRAVQLLRGDRWYRPGRGPIGEPRTILCACGTPLDPCTVPDWNASFVGISAFNFTYNQFCGRLQLPCLHVQREWQEGAMQDLGVYVEDVLDNGT